MRKYLLNGSIVSAVVSSISTLRTGAAGKTDWRFWLSVVASIITLVVAIGTVHIESKEMD